jgi:hypothetical protein
VKICFRERSNLTKTDRLKELTEQR